MNPNTDEWVAHHFDHLSPELAGDMHVALARAWSVCPVARSDAHEGGFWVLTRYEDILQVAQDWETWSSELGMTVPYQPTPVKILPVAADPPLQREFKRLVNAHFTPAKIAPWEAPTRELVNRLIDGFIERGECDFMTEFARPFPVWRSSSWRCTSRRMTWRRSTTGRLLRHCLSRRGSTTAS